MQERYREYLMRHGRELKGYPWRTPEVDRWRGELEEMADWLNNEQWPQPELDPQPEDVDWQELADAMETLSEERRANLSGRSTPTSDNLGL